MANPWFRMYSEFATDPKVQMLSEADQRRFIMLLCFRCSNGDVTLQDEEIAFQLRISNEEWSKTKAVLVGKGLIDAESQPAAWEKRQYVSDSSAARVAAHRERKKEEAKQACNVTVTPPDTDTDTEEEVEKRALVPSADDTSGYSAEFQEFWSAYPKRAGGSSKKATWKKWTARLRQGVKAEDLILAAKRYAEQMQAKGNIGTVYVKQAETFLGPDEYWRDALNSNIVQFQNSRDGKPALTAGQFYHPMWDDGIRVICHVDTHDEFGRPLGRQA